MLKTMDDDDVLLVSFNSTSNQPNEIQKKQDAKKSKKLSNKNHKKAKNKLIHTECNQFHEAKKNKKTHPLQ